MPKYAVLGEVTISVYTEVKAKNEEEAKEIADARYAQSFCHQCAGGSGGDNLERKEWRISGEIDGDITVVDIELLD